MIETGPQVEAEVMKVLNRLNEAYATKDINGVLELFVPDNDLIVFSVEEEGQIAGRADYKSHLEQEFKMAGEASFKINRISISAIPPVACVAAEVTLTALVKKNNRKASIPARWTMVLENRHGKWLIAQSHCSAAMPHSS